MLYNYIKITEIIVQNYLKKYYFELYKMIYELSKLIFFYLCVLYF
jgi:hypothetical protein